MLPSCLVLKLGDLALPGPDERIGWRFVRQKCSSLDHKNVKIRLSS